MQMIVLLAESEGMLQRMVDEFDRLCKRRKFKVNAGKSTEMVFKRAREQTFNFAKPQRVESEVIPGCKIWLGKKMEEVNELKYLGTILFKHGSMEGEIRERTVEGRQSYERKMCKHGGKKGNDFFFLCMRMQLKGKKKKGTKKPATRCSLQPESGQKEG